MHLEDGCENQFIVVIIFMSFESNLSDYKEIFF